MKDPIKIIHKFKNNDRRIQYNIYIFIGSLIDENIEKILNSIRKKSFYETLQYLNKKQITTLENYYGKKWYNYFFTTYHINYQREQILKSASKKKLISNKLGQEWIKKNLETKVTKKITYSFAANYYNYLLSRNKIKTKTRKVDMDFRTYLDDNIGGDGTDIPSEEEIIEDKIKKEESEEEEITMEDLDDEVVEDFNLDELTNLYSIAEEENKKDIDETSKLISQAIKDKKWEKTKKETEVEYNKNLDNLSYDAKLEEIHEKIYIRNEYIFKDDTIRVLRNKIAVSIPLNPKFGDIKLLPEYQYFWSNYVIDGKTDRVMIGQKWVRRNELLKVDIKPNTNIKVYENLRNNLQYLKDSIGTKIKRDDDESNIIRDYDDFMTNNEIFMTDIINELGINYNTTLEKKNNLYEVFTKIYYPILTFERFNNIIDLLNNKTDKETNLNENQYGNIKNDTKLESEISLTIERAKLESKKYDKLFNRNNILQSILHVDLKDSKNITGTVSKDKFNLYRIFDNFIVDEKYPFIQYQTPDSNLTYKFYKKTKKIDSETILAKWFENAPYGIGFRIKVDENKYVNVNLNENGKIEYKITWKELDKATVDDITNSYSYVTDLLEKINKENKKIKIIIPEPDKFKYAFINTILKFNMPEKFKINHNDLSEFSRFFYPYISLVIEPKKRESKKGEKQTTSKYGTYLRYKRITKYENRMRMHLRILYYLRNFELSSKELINEVAKQFNITMEDAAKELDIVKDKFSKALQKSSKVLKKLKAMPKSKPAGINIDIQGRERDRYKIRITGARSKNQLKEIIEFMKVLIYLYAETYLYKKSKYQKLKDTLKNLNKIAKRRNKVTEYVKYDTNIKNLKTKTALDKKRLAYKPEEGQSSWSRYCQNSGETKKRQPKILSQDNINELIKLGYKYNDKTKNYEKEITIEKKGKKEKVTLRVIKLPTSDDPSKFVYYACDPSINNVHTYVGFLARGNNPNDVCMPCCFKKDQLSSGNKKKESYYKKCLGDIIADEKVEEIKSSDLGDKLYILQDTNKVQEGRFIFLPKYLNRLFNVLWNNDNKIKNHYLTESKSGYFFKYTVKDNKYYFLAALANIYETTIEDIKTKLVESLKKDKDDRIYSYLNNGDIKAAFGEKSNFINYIETSNYLEYDIIGELATIPGVISKKQIHYFILEKRTTIIKKNLEEDMKKERYFLQCLNLENNFLMNQDNDFVIMINDGKYYFPIYRVQKDPSKDKKIKLFKKFNNNDGTDKVIDELKKYYSQSCTNSIINKINKAGTIEAKPLIHILTENKINIKKQLIDTRSKCRYIVLDKIVIPVKPSGIWHQVPYESMDSGKVKLVDISTTIKEINKINKILDLDYIPISVLYDKKSGSSIRGISIKLKNGLLIPIKQQNIKISSLKKFGLSYSFKSLDETIDKAILTNNNESNKRRKNVKEHIYKSEGYNLYRLELSLFLNKNTSLKNRIINIVRSDTINDKNKKYELRKILFNLIDSKLSKRVKLTGGGKSKNVAQLVKEIGNIENYNISNIRDYCNINKNKDKCNSNYHCIWTNKECKFKVTEELAIDYVNKVIEEMSRDSISFKEIIQEDDYYISDIVNYKEYTNRDNQKIIKTSNLNIKKIMSELFGQDTMPTLGRRINKKSKINVEEDYLELIELGKQLIQPIISNKDSIIRAYVNSYYWMNNPLYDKETRNLGFKSELQTQITNRLKAAMIDFIQQNKNNNEFKDDIGKTFKNKKDFFKSSINKFRKSSFNTNGHIELFILSYLYPYPIVVFDNFGKVKYLYMKGRVKVTDKTIKNFTNSSKIKTTIFLKFDFEGNNTTPKNIYAIYYN